MTKEQLIETKVDYSAIGEAIDHELAAKMVKDFNDASKKPATCFIVGKQIIETILAQPGCVSMRFYNAIDETGKETLVYAGVDENGKTILEIPSVNEIGKLGTVPAIVADRTLATNSWWND